MASVETGLQSSLKSHKMLKSLISSPALKNKKTSSISYVSLKKVSVGKGVSNTLTFSKKDSPHKPAQGNSQNYTVLCGDIYSQVNHSISLIEDPLGKRVCTEIVNVVGPQFVKQCSCVILGNLQQYFPTLKKIKVKNKFSVF